MKAQKFGIEIEMTGITKEQAGKIIADYFGTESIYVGGTYKTSEAKDTKGRIWKAMYDSVFLQIDMESLHGRECYGGLLNAQRTVAQ